MLSVYAHLRWVSQISLHSYAKCRFAESRYVECRYAECHYADCRYAECHGAIFLPRYLILAHCWGQHGVMLTALFKKHLACFESVNNTHILGRVKS